jgi:hypothetical protein
MSQRHPLLGVAASLGAPAEGTHAQHRYQAPKPRWSRPQALCPIQCWDQRQKAPHRRGNDLLEARYLHLAHTCLAASEP